MQVPMSSRARGRAARRSPGTASEQQPCSQAASQPLAGSEQPAAEMASLWRAGLAKVAITPQTSIWLDGWGGRTAPSAGVSQDIHAKVLALCCPDDDLLSVVVSCDLCGLTASVIAAVSRFALAAHGIPCERLVLHVTHNHSGPRLSKDRGYFSDISYPKLTAAQWDTVDEYTGWLQHQICSAITLAVDAMVPARLRWAQGVAGIAANRRRDRDGPGTRERPIAVDQDVPVLEVRSADGGVLLGVLFGYAMHPTCTDDGTIHGDWCGWAQHYVEQAHPGAIAVFVQGCGSDANPIPRSTSIFRPGLDQMYGQILAYAVDDALHASAARSSGGGGGRWLSGPLHCGRAVAMLPFDPVHMPSKEALLQLAAGADDGTTERKQRAAQYQLGILECDGQLESAVPFPTQVWGFGAQAAELRIVFLTGEVVADYALRLKATHGVERTWVAAYANQLLSYIPSERVLAEGGMEGHTAMEDYGLPCRYAPGIEERIVGAVAGLVEGMESAPSATPQLPRL